MRFRLTFITGVSLLFMAVGLYLALTHAEGYVGQRYFFTMLGIFGWFVGNRLVELDERVADLERAAAERKNPGDFVEPEAATEASGPQR